ncbi:MAG: glycosyltransferase family 4 protein [Alicyclobacillus sp.]|nr:glycosyltransferase family 4 protein [Alicyclobacillus sp.]
MVVMRIAFVITRSDTVGGAHVHLRELALGLSRRGHEVFVLVGGEGPFTSQLREHGIPYHALRHLVRPIRPIKDYFAWREMVNVLQGIKPDIVATHSSKAGWLGRLAGRSLRIPATFTVHGWSFTDGVPIMQRKLYSLAERLIMPATTHCITVSDYDRNLALTHKVAPPNKLTTIHNGVPDIPLHLRANPGLSPVKMVMVARLEPQKDHALLLKALVAVHDMPWDLKLVGDGPLRPHVEEAARELGLRDRIHFVGASNDVPHILRDSQLFLLISKWEGLPISILEAMRAGLPVVASDVGGVSEAVKDGVTGYIVPRGEVNILAERIRRLILSPTLRKEMGDAGRLRYESNFHIATMIEKTLHVYSTIKKPNR